MPISWIIGLFLTALNLALDWILKDAGIFKAERSFERKFLDVYRKRFRRWRTLRDFAN